MTSQNTIESRMPVNSSISQWIGCECGSRKALCRQRSVASSCTAEKTTFGPSCVQGVPSVGRSSTGKVYGRYGADRHAGTRLIGCITMANRWHPFLWFPFVHGGVVRVHSLRGKDHDDQRQVQSIVCLGKYVGPNGTNRTLSC